MLRSTATPRASALAQRRLQRVVHRAVAGRGDDDAVDTGSTSARDRAAVDAGCAGDDLDPRPGRRVVAAARSAPSGVGTRAAARDDLDAARPRRGRAARRRPTEGVEPTRMRLAHVARRSGPAPAKTTTHAARARRRGGDGDRVGRFCGPSAWRDVAGRIAPVSTTGLAGARTRCRKYAVSSSVSVPCVTTTPATSGRARWCATARASRRQVGEVHVLAVELRDLLALDRDAGRQRRAPATSASTPTRRRRCSRRRRRRDAARAGDRAAGAEDDDRAARLCIISRNWMKIQDWMNIQRPVRPVAPGRLTRRSPMQESPKLTDRQQQILDLVQSAIERTGAPPTRAEIANELGFKSANAAEEHLQALARKGVIELVGGTSRGIRLQSDTLRALQPGARQAVQPAAAEPGAALAAAGRPGRGRQPDPGAGAHRPDLPDGGEHVLAPARLPAQGARHEHARRRHHGRRPARRAEGEATRRTARSSSPASATTSPSSASGARAAASSCSPENPEFETDRRRPGRRTFEIEGLAVGLIRNNMLM